MCLAWLSTLSYRSLLQHRVCGARCVWHDCQHSHTGHCYSTVCVELDVSGMTVNTHTGHCYSTVCVELDVSGMAVNTLIQVTVTAPCVWSSMCLAWLSTLSYRSLLQHRVCGARCVWHGCQHSHTGHCYSTVCVELDVSGMAVNTLIQVTVTAPCVWSSMCLAWLSTLSYRSLLQHRVCGARCVWHDCQHSHTGHCYSTVCVELDVSGMAVNTLIQVTVTAPCVWSSMCLA